MRINGVKFRNILRPDKEARIEGRPDPHNRALEIECGGGVLADRDIGLHRIALVGAGNIDREKVGVSDLPPRHKPWRPSATSELATLRRDTVLSFSLFLSTSLVSR